MGHACDNCDVSFLSKLFNAKNSTGVKVDSDDETDKDKCDFLNSFSYWSTDFDIKDIDRFIKKCADLNFEISDNVQTKGKNHKKIYKLINKKEISTIPLQNTELDVSDNVNIINKFLGLFNMPKVSVKMEEGNDPDKDNSKVNIGLHLNNAEEPQYVVRMNMGWIEGIKKCVLSFYWVVICMFRGEAIALHERIIKIASDRIINMKNTDGETGMLGIKDTKDVKYTDFIKKVAFYLIGILFALSLVYFFYSAVTSVSALSH